jgi:hypothetical protein
MCPSPGAGQARGRQPGRAAPPPSHHTHLVSVDGVLVPLTSHHHGAQPGAGVTSPRAAGLKPAPHAVPDPSTQHPGQLIAGEGAQRAEDGQGVAGQQQGSEGGGGGGREDGRATAGGGGEEAGGLVEGADMWAWEAEIQVRGVT